MNVWEQHGVPGAVTRAWQKKQRGADRQLAAR